MRRPGISLSNLVEGVAKQMGKGMTDAELHGIIDEAVRDRDSKVNQEEILRIMKKTNLF